MRNLLYDNSNYKCLKQITVKITVTKVTSDKKNHSP